MSRPTAAPSLSFVPKEHGASFMSIHAVLLGTVAGLAAGAETSGASRSPSRSGPLPADHGRRVGVVGGALALASVLAVVVGPLAS